MITITKDKIYRSNFSLKKTKPDSEFVEEIKNDDVIFLMGECVELGEDVTFKRIFDLIIYHKEFFNILFNAEMNGLEVDDFIADYEQEFDIIQPHQKYDLKLFWAGVVYQLDHEVEFYDEIAFEAFGKLDTRIDGEEYPISLAFSSLSEFKDKLIILDNTFEIQNSKSYQNELEVDFKANYRPFTLHNLMGTILEEISHYGSPEERELARIEVNKRRNEIGDWIDEGTLYDNISETELHQEFGEMMEEDYFDEDSDSFWDTLYPDDKPKSVRKQDNLDDIMIAISEDEDNLSLEEILEQAEEVEDYEKAAKIKKLIEKRDLKNGKN